MSPVLAPTQLDRVLFHTLHEISQHFNASSTRIVDETGSDLVPGHGFCSEEGAGEFDRQAFLVVLGFVLRHAEKDCSGVGGCRQNGFKTGE